MDLSLLIITCDNYIRYWPGMLYSLDFNWDFDKIPVYWASEELKLHDTKFECRGLEYKTNSKINEILTQKTDRNGFSNRVRIALEKIPTKWVIMMGEDMWHISNPGTETFSKLILFSELVSADAIKIHTKLHYYTAYRLEPTKYRIDGVELYKYSPGDNFLLTHNATIWNRKYLLSHMVDSEDPWTNEIEGSKRMSQNIHNHYHYNIHWYSQPGVCEMGQDSSDFHTLAPILDDRMQMRLLYDESKKK
jgi:hypothetical protein